MSKNTTSTEKPITALAGTPWEATCSWNDIPE